MNFIQVIHVYLFLHKIYTIRLFILQEQRQFALLEVERNIKQQKEYEIEVQSMLKSHKQKVFQIYVFDING